MEIGKKLNQDRILRPKKVPMMMMDFISWLMAVFMTLMGFCSIKME